MKTKESMISEILADKAQQTIESSHCIAHCASTL